MPSAINQIGSVQSSIGTPIDSIISGHSASPLAPSVTPSYANVVAAGMTPPPMSSGKLYFISL
jgi:hypothetical protein